MIKPLTYNENKQIMVRLTLSVRNYEQIGQSV